MRKSLFRVALFCGLMGMLPLIGAGCAKEGGGKTADNKAPAKDETPAKEPTAKKDEAPKLKSNEIALSVTGMT